MMKVHTYNDIRICVADIPADDGVGKRERENRAEQQLLSRMLGGDTGLCHDEHGKPFLSASEQHISISHSNRWLAVALSETENIGIDIEELQPRLERVKHMFLSDAELSALHTGKPLLALALCWSAKEAAYKLFGAKAGAMGEHVKLDIGSVNSVLRNETSVFQAQVGDETCRLVAIEQNEEYEIVLACKCTNKY